MYVIHSAFFFSVSVCHFLSVMTCFHDSFGDLIIIYYLTTQAVRRLSWIVVSVLGLFTYLVKGKMLRWSTCLCSIYTYLYSTEECFLSEIGLVINKSDPFTDLRIHQNKNSLVIFLSKWEVVVYPLVNASIFVTLSCCSACLMKPEGAGSFKYWLRQDVNTVVCSVMPSSWWEFRCEKEDFFRRCLHRTNITWRHSLICYNCWDHQ